MAAADDVRRLAALARLSIPETDVERFAREFDGILSYVSQINELAIPEDISTMPALRNVMREDGEPHTSGEYTEKLAQAFPERDGDYLKVKKIISYD